MIRAHQEYLSFAHVYAEVPLLSDPSFQPAGGSLYKQYFISLMTAMSAARPAILELKRQFDRPKRKITELVSNLVAAERNRFLGRHLMLKYLANNTTVNSEYAHDYL